MSQQEYHTGKLRHISSDSVKIEELSEKLCKENGIEEIPSYYNNWTETLGNELNNEYLILKRRLYKLEEHIEMDDAEEIQMWKNEDDTISFSANFYNGGGCLSEVLEDGLDILYKKQ